MLQCFFHDDCPVPEDCYIICFECQHAFTEKELVDLTNHEVHRSTAITRLEGNGAEVWERGRYVGPDPWGVTVEFKPYTKGEDIRMCPLCTHDF